MTAATRPKVVVDGVVTITMSHQFTFKGYTETRSIEYVKDANGVFVDSRPSSTTTVVLTFLTPIGTEVHFNSDSATLSEILDTIGE